MIGFSKMNALFNKRVLNLIPVIFFIIISMKIGYMYNHLLEDEQNFAKEQAKVLNAYSMSHRNYYQKLFIDKSILLNKKTIKALPAYSNSIISKDFSYKNSLNITERTVSSRARNPLNQADDSELKAIKFFQANPDKEEYFTQNSDKYYQYASALRISKRCLKCHGDRQSAPKYIRDNYSKSYNYKIGEVRGIMSIKVPVASVQNYFLRSFIENVIYDIILFIALFLGIMYLTKKSKTINHLLEKEIEEKTSELKNTYVIDKLTKLANRRQLIEDIKLHANAPHRHLAILNIDAFKDINDFYGHTLGDKVLKDFADTFAKECLSKENTIYKLPSDEFAVFSTKDMPQKEFVKNISAILTTTHKKEFVLDDNKIFIVVSCGIASNEDELMTTADIALTTAKKNNTNLVVYNKELDISQKIIENTKNVTILRNAIQNDNIKPFFQPIYNVRTKTIEKYECLVRIVQDDGTIILPYHFLDVAIKSKQYFHITKIMITKSFEYFKDKDYEFSINLSAADMTSDEMQEFIIKNIQEFPQPQRIVFEILENDKLGNYHDVKKFMHIIKRFGCKFAIDDFGSGYSNFSHVFELKVDYLKIDASLVKYISSDENSQIITKTIINFASRLGLKTIAEYVEDIESFEILEKMGVNHIQGYYIGKPQKDLI